MKGGILQKLARGRTRPGTGCCGSLGRPLSEQGDALFLVLLGKSARSLSLECSKESLMTSGWEGPEKNSL